SRTPRHNSSSCTSFTCLIPLPTALSSGRRLGRRRVGGFPTGRMRHFHFPHHPGRDLFSSQRAVFEPIRPAFWPLRAKLRNLFHFVAELASAVGRCFRLSAGWTENRRLDARRSGRAR